LGERRSPSISLSTAPLGFRLPRSVHTWTLHAEPGFIFYVVL